MSSWGYNCGMEFSNLTKSQKSLAGEFAVLSQLYLRGYEANLTLGNAKGIDILVTDPSSGKMFKIEVKTSPHKEVSEAFVGTGKFMYWVMGAKHAEKPESDLFYCMVSILSDGSFRYFVLPALIIAEYIRDEYAEYLRTHPHIQPKATLMRKLRIALDNPSLYLFEQPSAIKYENNWDSLRFQ